LAWASGPGKGLVVVTVVEGKTYLEEIPPCARDEEDGGAVLRGADDALETEERAEGDLVVQRWRGPRHRAVDERDVCAAEVGGACDGGRAKEAGEDVARVCALWCVVGGVGREEGGERVEEGCEVCEGDGLWGEWARRRGGEGGWRRRGESAEGG
jgi:hypothetical protein